MEFAGRLNSRYDASHAAFLFVATSSSSAIGPSEADRAHPNGVGWGRRRDAKIVRPGNCNEKCTFLHGFDLVFQMRIQRKGVSAVHADDVIKDTSPDAPAHYLNQNRPSCLMAVQARPWPIR